MKEKILVCFLVFTVFLTSGCIQPPNEGEQILIKVAEKYASLNTYKATETREWKIVLREKVLPEDGEKPLPPFEYTEKTEINRIVSDITYKRPAKLKVLEHDENIVTLTNNAIQWEYRTGDQTACKISSNFPIFQTNYLLSLASSFTGLYEIEYLGLEEINGKKHHVIKRTPEYERDPQDGDLLNVEKIWVTEDYLLAKRESYEDGEWKNRTSYTNFEINPNVSDAEFELPQGTEILPKTQTFSNVEEAQEAFGHEIKTPSYLPTLTSLHSIEINKLCNEHNYAVLNYEKNNENVLTIMEVVTGDVKKLTGYNGKICNSSGTDYLARSEFNGDEFVKIMEPFGCWREGSAGH